MVRSMANHVIWRLPAALQSAIPFSINDQIKIMIKNWGFWKNLFNSFIEQYYIIINHFTPMKSILG